MDKTTEKTAVAAVAIMLILAIVFPTMLSDPLQFAIAAAVSVAIALSVQKPVRKKIRHVVFDVGGVLLKGDYFTQQLSEMPGTKDVIKQLKKKGYKVDVLSNNNAIATDAITKHFKYNDLFDKTISSSDVGAQKPHPDSFNKMLAMINAGADEIVFVDDTPGNVEAAKKLGIKAVEFKSAAQLREELKRMGVDVD